MSITTQHIIPLCAITGHTGQGLLLILQPQHQHQVVRQPVPAPVPVRQLQAQALQQRQQQVRVLRQVRQQHYNKGDEVVWQMKEINQIHI